jgi:beta-lactamase regulating signal transducer with metallopeptidase domain
MTWLELWIQTSLATALAWTLLHSLWEGALAALLLAAGLSVLHSARARYAAACAALLALLIGFTITLARLWPAGVASTTTHVAAPPGPAEIDLAASDAIAPYGFHAGDLLPWIAPFWMLGVLAFQLRSVAGWIAARRLRRAGVCCAAADWTARLDRLAARIRISRPVTLFESSLADAPLVIGYLRPVILMPAGLLAGLPAAQVEAILAHELAHILRQDYLVNLAQTFIEGLLFYHPAVWWISHVIRAERENCCDDVAVAVSGNARQYAAALAALEQSRIAARELALAATGGSLVKRVRRILENPERSRVGFAPLASTLVLILATAAGLTAWQATPAPKPQAAAAPVVSLPSAPAESPAPAPVAQTHPWRAQVA